MINRTSTAAILTQTKTDLTLDLKDEKPKNEPEIISPVYGALYHVDLSSPKKAPEPAVIAPESVVIDSRNIMPTEAKETPSAENSNDCCLIM
ncbi:MAG: hypothetical protein ACYCQI_04890 [Gammaproteobacteria bacterium]